MAFNSIEYLVFFLAILGLTWLVVGFPRFRLWLMLLASYYFYASNNHWLIVLILISTQVDYIAGRRIEDSASAAERKAWLVASIVTNLSILGFFKYFNFFAGTFAELASAIGVNLDWVDLNIALPVGISFYTFQSMSYTIDVYRKHISAERSWLNFSFFVAYFPQLVAGPIVRPDNFLPQINKRPKLSVTDFEAALLLIFQGLFKKIVLGDFLGVYSDQAFNNVGEIDSFTAWLGVYAFCFQIYFDFSGYTDVAIGCSKLMGFNLPDNFKRPYVATSFSDFWKRWHISLSSWLRDYLYISLGGNKMKTKWGVYRNLMLTMLLGGLWHGAAWNFVFWGFLHGIYLVIEKMLSTGKQISLGSFKYFIKVILVFHLVLLTWIAFRAESLSDMSSILSAMFSGTSAASITNGMLVAWLVIALGWLSQFIVEFKDMPKKFLNYPISIKATVYALIAVAVCIMGSGEARPFIYFKF